jgi:hypothetical protein
LINGEPYKLDMIKLASLLKDDDRIIRILTKTSIIGSKHKTKKETKNKYKKVKIGLMNSSTTIIVRTDQ